jgi:hypothetical protein
MAEIFFGTKGPVLTPESELPAIRGKAGSIREITGIKEAGERILF